MKTKTTTLLLLLLATLTISSAKCNTTTTINIDSLIEQQVSTRYQGAIILELETEDGNIKGEIIHEQRKKSVIFNRQGVWQSTKYDLLKSELPKSIKDVIKASKYSSYWIDDIEVIETPSRSLYEIELDKWFNRDEFTIYITFEGKIL